MPPSLLLAAGEFVVAVTERLGHDDAALVLSTWRHLMPDVDDRTRPAVDDPGRVIASARGLDVP